MEKYGFVYIWLDKKYERYYIGSHWGTIDDGYVCSSSWMKQAYRKRPNDFKRRILFNGCLDRLNLLVVENYYLKMIRENELGKKYYNLKNHEFGHWSADEQKRVLVSKKTGWNKGLSKLTDIRVAKAALTISLSMKGKRTRPDWTNEQRLMESERFYKKNPEGLFKGRMHSEETKEKIRKQKVGRSWGSHSEESKEKMRLAKRKKL